tara:strand:- start:633 stop:791 length:159 start_codon:yes stop_codon:yes gene_type:complete
MLNNIITKEKIEQLERFNDLIKIMNKMSDNMQLMANRIVKLEQQVEMLNEKR